VILPQNPSSLSRVRTVVTFLGVCFGRVHAMVASLLAPSPRVNSTSPRLRPSWPRCHGSDHLFRDGSNGDRRGIARSRPSGCYGRDRAARTNDCRLSQWSLPGPHVSTSAGRLVSMAEPRCATEVSPTAIAQVPAHASGVHLPRRRIAMHPAGLDPCFSPWFERRRSLRDHDGSPPDRLCPARLASISLGRATVPFGPVE